MTSERIAVATACLALFVELAAVPASLARMSSKGQAAATQERELGGKLFVRFDGGDVNGDLARALNAILDVLGKDGLSGSTSIFTASKEAGVWADIIAELQLPASCPPEMQRVIRRLNPGLPEWKRMGAGVKVTFLSKDALTNNTIRRYYDLQDERSRTRYESVIKNWPYTVDQGKVENGEKQVVDTRRFELTIRVPNAAMGRNIVSRIRRTTGNAFAEYRGEHEPKPSTYFTAVRPNEYWEHVARGTLAAGEQASMGEYAGIHSLPKCASIACAGLNCPDVVLVDSAVYPHRDLTGVLTSDSEVKRVELQASSGVSVAVDNSVDADRHGTYMLGIMASREDDGAGLVGVHPVAKVSAYDWDRYHQTEAGDDFVSVMSARDDDDIGRLPIYVFANKWDLAKVDTRPRLATELTAIDSTARTKAGIASQIVGDPGNGREGDRSLWIVAAGQIEQKDPGNSGQLVCRDPQNRLGVDISAKSFAWGPMNLGDYESVLVVTACQSCDPEDLRLGDCVNYSSDGSVHLVAPGSRIRSTVAESVTDGKVASAYADGNGTSPATALVAGVASAMVSCYPIWFSEAWRVKERLQATSKPVFSGRDRDRVAAGIVDGSLALSDPAYAYLKVGQEPLRAVEIVGWCQSTLNFRPPAVGTSRGDPTLDTGLLLRLQRRGQPRDEWIAFSRMKMSWGGLAHGRVRVHGPWRLKTKTSDNSPVHLVRVREIPKAVGGTWDGTGNPPENTVDLEDVEDLLVSPTKVKATTSAAGGGDASVTCN